MEQIAVSGSHGFIGSHLSKLLGRFEVLGRNGYIPNYIDVIFDLAAYGNLANQTQITETYQANLMRVINEFEYLDDQKYVYMSTSSVTLPVQTPYSLSKKATEEFIKYMSSKFQKRCAIVRPYTVVGIGEPDVHLLPRLIDSCLNGTEMPFVPEPVHDYVDVDDLVDALLLIKDKGLFEGEIYEIGTGGQTSNDAVRGVVEEITGKKANLKIVKNLRPYDSNSWRANAERIASLGWKPKRDLYQTIKNMVDYEQQRIEAENN